MNDRVKAMNDRLCILLIDTQEALDERRCVSDGENSTYHAKKPC